MTHIEFTGSALRAWNLAPKLPPHIGDTLVRVWIHVQELELAGELDSLRIGRRRIVEMRNPRVNIYIRRTQVNELLIYRIAKPK